MLSGSSVMTASYPVNAGHRDRFGGIAASFQDLEQTVGSKQYGMGVTEAPAAIPLLIPSAGGGLEVYEADSTFCTDIDSRTLPLLPAPRMSEASSNVSLMKMPKEWLTEQTQLQMTDAHSGDPAPISLWGAVASLNGGTVPDDAIACSNGDGGGTTWQVTWVANGQVGFVRATSAQPNWTAHPRFDGPDEVTAWRRPVAEVAAVELTTVDCRKVTSYNESGGEWQWASVQAKITFNDGTTAELPPFGPARNNSEDQRVQAQLDSLRTSTS